MARYRRHLALVVAAMSVAGCGKASDSATPTPDRGIPVYTDDFANANGGWQEEKTTDHLLTYATVSGNQGYLIRTLTDGASAITASPNSSMPNKLVVSVGVTVSGAGGGMAGVGCDYDGVGYVVMVRPGATYEIEKISGAGVGAVMARGSAVAMTVPSGTTTVELACVPSGDSVSITATLNKVDVSNVVDTDPAPSQAKKVRVWLRGVAGSVQSDAFFTKLRVYSA